MIEWWSALSLSMKILWCVTLASSVIFIIQSIMTFLGADTDGMDADFAAGGADMADAGGTGANLYTFRNLVNFCLGFGWCAILLQESIKSTFLLLAISAIVGCVLVAIVMYLFKAMGKMQQSGTINVEKMAVGCGGKVYLTIPGEKSGEGKVQITINGCVREYDALTLGETLPTGAPVIVTEVIDAQTLLVNKQ